MPMPQKKSLRKKVGLIAASFVGGFFILALMHWCVLRYADWRSAVEYRQAEAAAERPYREDIYGGQTPKETLELFIAAIEKNNFDLASKYFVLSKQEEWRNSLSKGGASKKLGSLKAAVGDAVTKLSQEDPIWQTKDAYVFLGKNSVSFQFVKYPSGVWKIQEI